MVDPSPKSCHQAAEPGPSQAMVPARERRKLSCTGLPAIPVKRKPTMGFYSVHLQGDGPDAAAGAQLVRQAFNWSAFFFGPFWLAWQGLWGALALWALAYFVLIAASLIIPSGGAVFFIVLALQTFLGLEAGALCERKLAAQGYHLAAVIAAPSSVEAEITYFRQRETQDAPPAGTALAGPGTEA
jgi:hypothetical protein